METLKKLGRIQNGPLRWTVGIFLILLGITGGFIPILQGWVLILAGIGVINSQWLKEQYEKFKK